MTGSNPIVLHGETRSAGGTLAAATVTLERDAFSVAVGDAASWSAGYRDVATVLVDAGTVLVRLGTGAGAEQWVFERFGTGLGALVRGRRDGRLRRWLTDGLIERPDGEAI